MAWRFLEAEVLVHKYTAIYNRNQVLENQVLEVEVLYIGRENLSKEVTKKLLGTRFTVNVGRRSILCAGDVASLSLKVLLGSLSHSSILMLDRFTGWIPEVQLEEVVKARWLRTVVCDIQESTESTPSTRTRKLHYELI